MRDAGIRVHPTSFLIQAHRLFEDEIVFTGIYGHAEAMAAGAGFVHKWAFDLAWAATDLAYGGPRPETLLHGSLMQEMGRRGLRVRAVRQVHAGRQHANQRELLAR